jgi:protoporphyrinogen oxidase
MKIGIIGGGIMGISLGYYLTQQNFEVEIFEASPVLGGLAGPITLEDGTNVDRFYHAILSSDRYLMELCQELGIEDQLRFKETKMGFYYKNAIYPMNNVVDFMKFPPLGWIDRFRLGVTVIAAQFYKDWMKLESVNVEKWLVGLSGKRTFQNIWRPMLMAKFDGGFENTPATYIWARLVRMKSTRGGASQKEEAGHLIGGYITLIKAMAEKIQAKGGKIHLSSAVKEIVIENGRAIGIRMADGEVSPYDCMAATVQSPIFARLIPGADPAYQAYLGKTDYLGVVAPLLILEQPLTSYWTLNITDETIPFTGVIETTAYIDPKYVGGHHLVYLPKYTAPGSLLLKKTDDEIKEMWLKHLKTMFPNFDPSTIKYFLVNRERYVEPLHGMNQTHLIPAVKTPVQGLYLSTTAQIYPELTNGESVCRYAKKSATMIIEDFKKE